MRGNLHYLSHLTESCIRSGMEKIHASDTTDTVIAFWNDVNVSHLSHRIITVIYYVEEISLLYLD